MLKDLRIFRIQQSGILINFFNFTIWKIDFLQYQKLLNILGVQTISKKWKKSSKRKLSNNLSFFILIFTISKFRNTGLHFVVPNFDPPPYTLMFILKNDEDLQYWIVGWALKIFWYVYLYIKIKKLFNFPRQIFLAILEQRTLFRGPFFQGLFLLGTFFSGTFRPRTIIGIWNINSFFFKYILWYYYVRFGFWE